MMCRKEKVSIFVYDVILFKQGASRRSLNSTKGKRHAGRQLLTWQALVQMANTLRLLMARLLAGPRPNSCLDWQKVINCKNIQIYKVKQLRSITSRMSLYLSLDPLLQPSHLFAKVCVSITLFYNTPSYPFKAGKINSNP